MRVYVEKCVFFFVTLLFVFSAVFLALRIVPGDPLDLILSEESLPEEREIMRAELGLDKTILEQYQYAFMSLLKGDLGNSLFKRAKVTDLLKNAVLPTITLSSLAIILAFCIGVMGGLFLSYSKDKEVYNLFPLIILSIPIFSIGPLLVYLFSIKLQLLPVSEWISWKHKILPVFTIALPLGAILSRVIKYRLDEEKNADWVHFLKAKGLSPYGIYIRLVKKISTTISQVIGIQLSVILAGTMVTETIFDIPGMGMLLIESIQMRDYPVIQGVVLYSSFIYLVIYFFVDLINLYLDPRLRV